MIDRVRGRHTLEGLLVDPIEGAFPGALVVEDGLVAEVRRVDGGARTPLVFPGFVDLQVYDPGEARLAGVTGYLLATRTVAEVDDHDLGGPGEITCVIQAKYEDALHGRAPEYREWLDVVEQPSKVTS